MKATGSHAKWLEVVNAAIGGRRRGWLLDLCCGGCAVTRHLKYKNHVGIDLVDNPERPENVHLFRKDVLAMMKMWVREDYDLCVISDGLEHLDHERGLALMKEMKRVADMIVVFVPDDEKVFPDSIDPHTHKHHWTAKELVAHDFKVTEFPDWHGDMGARFGVWEK